MKIILTVLTFMLAINVASAQIDDTTHPQMTESFVDSLKMNIGKIITTNHDIELRYQASVAPDGRVISPVISKQTNYNQDINYNPLVQQLKVIIINAPAWVPAFDGSKQQKPVPVSFNIRIYKDHITILDLTD